MAKDDWQIDKKKIVNFSEYIWNFLEFSYIFESTFPKKIQGYNRETVCSTTRKILDCVMKYS